MKKDLRDAVFDTVYDLAKNDKDVIFLSADADAWSLRKFKNDFPDRYFNMGVAEQNTVTVASGLALSGKKVFICAIIPFITLRCFEQIKVDICSMNLPITIIGMGAGLSFGYDGPTHHAVCDISIMRTLPELHIYNPSDTPTCISSVQESYASLSPCYIRLDKGVYNDFNKLPYTEFSDGFSVLKRGNTTCLISTGILSHDIISLVENREKINNFLGHIDIYKIKSFSKLKILDEIKRYNNIIVVEENIVDGSLGTMLLEFINDNNLDVVLKRIGLPNVQSFIYGDRDWLWRYYKIDNDSVDKEII